MRQFLFAFIKYFCCRKYRMPIMRNFLKTRLSIMFFMEYAVWGSYLISMGVYLSSIGLGNRIGWFFAAQGIVSLFMPALMGVVADRWVKPQRLYAICHLLSAMFMALMAYRCASGYVGFEDIFPYYCLSILFFMPTVALSNSICFTSLQKAGIDVQSSFPRIRMFGTIGFICAMWAVNFLGIQASYLQFLLRAGLGVLLVIYSFSLPDCTIDANEPKRSVAAIMGIKAFNLFRRREMAVFFIFSMLLGVCLQISNGYASPFIDSFAVLEEFSDAFFVKNSILLISLSQISEAFCLLLLPFCLKRFGIKRVIIISLLAWSARYALLGFGNPTTEVWMFFLSMVLYGVAFDFFHIAGSMYVDRNTDCRTRSCGQGLYMMMTNGFGASIGMLTVQYVVNRYTDPVAFGNRFYTVGDWKTAWLWFALFALLVALLFALTFKSNEKDRVGD